MGRTRGLAERLADISFPIESRRLTLLGRDLCRGCVCACQKRGPCIGKTKRGKGTKLMVVADSQSIPLGIHLASASPNEVTLIEETLGQVAVSGKRGRPRKNPSRLIYDRAADSDPLRRCLARRGIELICPHRSNRTKPKTQDGRKLRRYKRRWKVERLVAWIGNYRRLLIRWERKVEIFRAFLYIACLMITLRQL